MIGWLLEGITGKKLVLYNSHRQTLPIIQNEFNKRKYFFIVDYWVWRFIPFPYSSKWKYKFVYMLLNILGPSIILDINWITLKGGLYYLWSERHRPSKFVVLQHGSYVGGIVTDVAHRYTKCDIFLTWSDYFTNIFQEYNQGKRVQIKTFGNSVYNLKSRENFEYSIKKNTKRVLFAPSAVSKDRKVFYLNVIDKLSKLGFEVAIKEHNMQNKLFGPLVTSNEKVAIVSEFKWAEYDLYITDISSFLLDAVYHKEKVLFCCPYGDNELVSRNIYSKYLKNSFPAVLRWKSQKDLVSYIDKDKQEKLFNQMLTQGNNQLSEL